METLRLIIDGLSLASLSIMAAASYGAWKQIPPDVRVPMQWGLDRKPTWRADKRAALLLTPVLAFLILFGLMALSQFTEPTSAAEAVNMLLVRLTVAGIFGFIHLLHVTWALKTLAGEGQLRPKRP